MRVLASFVGGWGHAQPVVAITDVARRRGHEITFAGQRAMIGRLRELGYDTVEVGPDTVGPERRPLVAVDVAFERQVLADHFAGTFADIRAETLIPVIEQRRPDIVVCDEVDFGAMVAAECTAVARSSVVVAAAGLLAGPSVVGESLVRLRHTFGLPGVPALDMLAGDLPLVPVPRSFRSPDAPLPDRATLIRPSILDRAQRGRTSRERPLIYMTMGTIFNVESGDLFERCIEAARTVDADFVLTVGPYIDPAEVASKPANVTVTQFVDHADLLPRCDLVVCHGGSGTVIESLSLGVPLVLLPMGADQPDNADRCSALGVGVQLEALTATPTQIALAIEEVRTDGHYRTNANAIAEEAALLPSTDHAVDLLEAVAG